ncbi:putative HTH-type transcriptional regulator YdfF [Dictyobacter sp. S3.2.2.5]|uniref:HTH-type transcriptional regulator YdfF n=1 Tax=Dictyobacter halimunensis TaxID=3026934 RepID=A0ABQ6FVZ2_9CHLR|nr:putative HTH-type transcriptional regulator YdfF [Dictyobacter sp. S3.2.2.5]
MTGDTNIASVAALLADPTRVNILMALSDGRAFTANELSRLARVAPSTASGHLARLVDADLINVEKQGRHRFFRMKNPALTEVLEELATFAPAHSIHSLREAEVGEAVRRARTCYNHVAGKLGVEITRALIRQSLLIELEDGYMLSREGERCFCDLGITDIRVKKGQPIFAPRHIDWSERYYHFAGAPGAAFTRRMFELGWIKRIATSRALCVTETGQQALRQHFELQW